MTNKDITERIIERIRGQVVDPELRINVVDLGLIYEVRVEEEKIEIDMTLTSAGCPYGETLVREVKLAGERESGRPVAVEVVWEPAWSRDRMSQEAKDQLMFFGSF